MPKKPNKGASAATPCEFSQSLRIRGSDCDSKKPLCDLRISCEFWLSEIYVIKKPKVCKKKTKKRTKKIDLETAYVVKNFFANFATFYKKICDFSLRPCGSTERRFGLWSPRRGPRWSRGPPSPPRPPAAPTGTQGRPHILPCGLNVVLASLNLSTMKNEERLEQLQADHELFLQAFESETAPLVDPGVLAHVYFSFQNPPRSTVTSGSGTPFR